MDASDVVVEVRDKDLVRRAVLSDTDLAGAEFVAARNDIGSWMVKLPGSLAGVSHDACWWLRQEGSGIVASFGGRTFSGSCESRQRSVSAENPEGLWTFTGVTDIAVLAREFAFPDPARAATAQTTRANDTRTDEAESLLHTYVGANIGPGSLRARVTLGADLGRGSVRTESPRFTSLLELCQKIAGTELCFDIVQDGAALKFVTWVPADRSVEVSLDVDSGGLSRFEYQMDAPTVTRAIVLGAGEGTARKVRLVTLPTPLAAEAIYGARTVVIDQRQTDDDAELDQAGYDAINEGMAVTSSAAIPTDDLLADVLPGDLVSVVDGDDVWKVPLETLPVVIGDGVYVGGTVGDPIGEDDTAVVAAMLRRQQKLGSRLARLERGV